MALLRVTLALLLLLGAASAQETPEPDEPPAPEQESAPPVALTFTPPALEGDIVLGIFDARGGLVRTLRFERGSPALRIDTNGYIAQWDGRDEAGAACPAGRYAARGYVVGDQVSVEGEAFHFNDWAAEDRIPATGVKLLAWPDALGVELATASGPRYAQIAPDGTLAVVAAPPAAAGPPSRWVIVEEAGEKAVVLPGEGGEAVRRLRVARDEPQPVEVLAAPDDAAILLREEGPGGRQRVRMLRRTGPSTDPAPGAAEPAVSDWEVVFERELRPVGAFGLVDGALQPDAGGASAELTVPLVENALEPGPASVRLHVGAAKPGSALFAPCGLALVEISAEGEWTRFAVVPGAKRGEATVFQGNGLLVEEFALRHLDEIAAFDAGAFLLRPAAQ